MSTGRAAIAGAVVAATAGGCGLGAGPSTEGEASLTVTRDYGSEVVLETSVEDPTEAETVVRLLDREAEIETRYGGGFVQSIEGLSADVREGRSLDWFFFVNGIESSLGAAEAEVRGGDRIWWDYRDWTAAMRTPAVVGSFPEPFAQASAAAERLPVRVECGAPRRHCDAAAERLSDVGVEPSVDSLSDPDAVRDDGEALRLLVGTWARLRADALAAELDRGPGHSGVFARFEPAGGGYELVGLDPRGEPAATLGPRAGLVAALRDGEEPPTWLVTGTDRAGVGVAVKALVAGQLADRYAVGVEDGDPISLPVLEEGG